MWQGDHPACSDILAAGAAAELAAGWPPATGIARLGLGGWGRMRYPACSDILVAGWHPATGIARLGLGGGGI